MTPKFEELVNSILEEGIGDPGAEAAAVEAGNAARDQRLADLGARSSYSSGPRRRYDDEAPAAPHYEVFLSPEGKAKYKKALEYMVTQKPELAPLKKKMEEVQYNFRSFSAKHPEKAREFAAKYGMKDENGQPKYTLVPR